jgi:hypothetical protein
MLSVSTTQTRRKKIQKRDALRIEVATIEYTLQYLIPKAFCKEFTRIHNYIETALQENKKKVLEQHDHFELNQRRYVNEQYEKMRSNLNTYAKELSARTAHELQLTFNKTREELSIIMRQYRDLTILMQKVKKSIARIPLKTITESE